MMRRACSHNVATLSVLFASSATTMTAVAIRPCSTNTPPKEGEEAGDSDGTHFRATLSKHPLYEKPERLMKEAIRDAEHRVVHSTDNKNQAHPEWDNPIKNAIWTEEEVAKVEWTHRKPEGLSDWVAFSGVKLLRLGFDIVSGYRYGNLTDRKLLRRILFLETAAGIPGMVASSLRHLSSLRNMKRDYGWIHTLEAEAENERMHMLVFMHDYKPGIVFRGAVVATQLVFWNVFFLAYLISPCMCHRFVGYLEEEAVRTYTDALKHIDSTAPEDKTLHEFGKRPANDIAKRYWRLKADATMRDTVLAVRADEANHRDVNHTLASLGSCAKNPFCGKH